MAINREFHAGVTYVIPVHNPDNSLISSIKSIAKNEFLYEILVINDYSNVGLSIFEEIKKISQVRVVANIQVKGISGALNTGLDEVRSEYVARLDSGDIDLPNRIAIQHMKLLKENVDIVISDMLVVTGNNAKHSLQKAYHKDVFGVIAPWSIVPHPTWFFKIKSVTSNYQQENIRTEDYCFLVDNNFRIAISHEAAILYDGRGSICVRNELIATYFKVRSYIVNARCKLLASVLGVLYGVARSVRVLLWQKKFLKR